MSRRSPARLLTVLAACVPLTALVLAGTPMAGASSLRASASPASGPPYPLNFDYGYADTNRSGNTYSHVEGRWVVPQTTCTHPTTETAFWVGLDGYSNDSQEEAGVLVRCSNERHYISTFYYMPGDYQEHLVGRTVKKGNKIRASITVTGTTYKLTVTDLSNRANSFTRTETCPATTCPDTSAEWVTGPGMGFSMAKFSSWKLMDATATSGTATGPISSFPDQNINNYASPLNSTGAGFTANWPF